jgi:hypothetical protein
MSQTREQLISAVARVLGMLPAGQTIAAEDYADLDAQIDPAVAELRRRDVYYTANTSSFQDEVVSALADCIACICASQQEVSQIRGIAVDQVRPLAETRLRQMAATRPTYETLRGQYF